jgi:glycosyltransferase involved in cell wall biosynthesis
VDVALIVPGSIDAIGGAGMRWRALRHALGPAGCTVHELTCDRRGRCHDVCRTTSRPRRLDGPPIWYHNRKFCPASADAVLLRLVDQGVSTVVCSGLETFEYVRHWASTNAVTVVYDMHNVESQLYRAIGAATAPGSIHAKLFRPEHIAMVAEAEEAAISCAHQVWCCTEADRDLIAATYAGMDRRKVRVVPNVVPLPALPADPRRTPDHACFVGRLDHYPNLLAARTLATGIAPLLRRAGRSMPVIIAGAGLNAATLGGVADNVRLVADPPSTTGIIARGVMTVPLTIGGGSRLKILEAFAAGAPIVSTAKGVEGLDVRPGEHYVQAETAQQFAAAIIDLVSSSDLRRRIVTAGWRLVRDTYSLDALRTTLTGEDTFRSLVPTLPPRQDS